MNSPWPPFFPTASGKAEFILRNGGKTLFRENGVVIAFGIAN